MGTKNNKNMCFSYYNCLSTQHDIMAQSAIIARSEKNLCKIVSQIYQ